MKLYISKTYFNDVYGYKGNEDAQDQTEDNFKMNAQKASSRTNVLTQGAIAKGVTAGLYVITDDLITVADNIDASIKATETEKIDAVREAICLMTQFAIDTGYDFLTGSFSSNLGAEGLSESIDFEASKEDMERHVKELLGVYEWDNVLVEGQVVQVASDEAYDEPRTDLESEDRPLTKKQYVTHHGVDHIAGDGIIITPNLNTGAVKIELDPNTLIGDLFVDDAEILATEAHITATEAEYE